MKTLTYLYSDIKIFFIFLCNKENRKMLVSNKIKEERLEKCKNCEHQVSQFSFKRCGICGCFLNFKTRLSFEECPDSNNQKWSIVDERE